MNRRGSHLLDLDDISSQSSSSEDEGKLGKKIVQATKFLGTIVGKNRRNDDDDDDIDLDADRYRISVNSADEAEKADKNVAALDERYNEANEGNLYKCLRSVRHTDGYNGIGGKSPGLDPEEMSFGSSSDMSMPRIDEGDNISDEDDSSSLSNGKELNLKPSSDVSSHSIPSARRASIELDDSNNDKVNRNPRRSGGGILRAIGLGPKEDSFSNKSIQAQVSRRRASTERRSSAGGRSSAERRSSAMSTATEDSGGDTNINRWFSSFTHSFNRDSGNNNDSFNRDLQRLRDEENMNDDNDDYFGTTDTNNNGPITKREPNASETSNPYTDHHAKSRATFMKRNVSHAATDKTSFRILQHRMKEKGAITGSSIIHMLQEAAEEHAVENIDHTGGDGLLNSDRDAPSIDLRGLDCNNDNLDENAALDGKKRDDYGSSNDSSMKYLGRAEFQHEEQQIQAQDARRKRLELDPIFGGKSGGDAATAATVIRPYIAISSRESKFEQMKDALCRAADQGQSCLITVTGEKFVGKSSFMRKAIDTVNIEGLGYTVLSSTRSSANDGLTSYFAFREIVSGALRACDAMTTPHNFGGPKGSQEVEGSDELVILQRLIHRKVLNKSDQLMLGRILPAVMNNQLLSLLIGRNPVALTKDIVSSLFKIMIPLQPVMLLLEADGDDCKIDSSSWDLIEELLLAANEQCPQMVLIAVSRHSLSNDIPAGIIADDTNGDNGQRSPNKHINIHIEQMDKVNDTECYIRALFCGSHFIDRNMTVDSAVLEGVYNRARGCPLFTERIVLWSQRNGVIELDETRNAVALDLAQEEASLLDTLPHNLNEELLEVISHFSHHLLDSLKVAACMGITFDLNKYEALKNEQGLHDSLQEVIESHGIFDCDQSTKSIIDGSVCIYRWKHVAVFEAVESIIISNERIEIHCRIADSLAQLEDDDHYSRSSSISGNNNINSSKDNDDAQYYAWDYVMAQRWDDAFDRYMEAGTHAEERLDFVGAVTMYQQAEACLTKSHKKPSLRRRLSPHAAMGWCLRELTRFEEAEMELEFCLKKTMAVPEEKRNEQFEEIELDVVTTLATLKQAESKYSEAMEMYERALPIARANREKHSRVWLAHHVSACAEIYRKSGNLEQARSLHTEALSYRELAVEEYSCTVLELALSFTQLGCTLSGLGEHSQAFSLHKKALAARVEHLDFYHSLTSESLNYCADALQALGRGNEGIPLGMHAVKIRKFVFSAKHPAYAHALSVLSSCYHSVDRSFDSLVLMKECLDICEKAFSSKSHANLIPNLLLYGSVLSVTGNVNKAKEVYDRALDIHKMNFKEGQNAKQLVKLRDATEALSFSGGDDRVAPAVASLEMPIPRFEPDNSSKTHVIVCANIGQRASDEYMLSLASSLQQMGALKLIAVIAVRPPQVARANIARGALDSLLLSYVPVAYSGVVSSAKPSSSKTTIVSNADYYGKQSAHMNNTGVELMTRALLQAPEKSLVIMCTACMGDVCEVMNTHRDLFVRKVKQIVVIGSVKPVRRRGFIEPEEEDEQCGLGGGGVGNERSFAKQVYQCCQELGIPTVTLSNEVSRGFPFSSAQVDDLTLTNHMISTKIQRTEEMNMNGIWEMIRSKDEAKGNPALKRLDVKSFCNHSLGGKNPSTAGRQIWPWITSINLELVLGLLACLPAYQDAHFRWETHQVMGVEHKVCRHSNAAAGVIRPDALSNEIHMLIGLAFRTSLLNTSC